MIRRSAVATGADESAAPPEGISWPEDNRYVAAFDGVRAVAVILVVWCHTTAMLEPAPLGPLTAVADTGWIGVDVFFTLSGFLITGILLGTRGRPGYFRSFYVRRVLRIFPLYFGLVTLVLAPRALAGVASPHPWWSFYTFTSNYFVARSPVQDFALDATWSLAVEEQFYLVWPALVALAPRRMLVGVIALVALSSPIVRLWVHDPVNMASYNDTWCRLDALALGALGAVAWHGRARWAVAGARRLALPALLLLAALVASGEMDFHALRWAVPGYSVVAAAVAVILLAVASDGVPALRRALTTPPLVHVGRVSYGIYLLHPFVLAALGVAWPLLPVPAPKESIAASLVAFALGPLLTTAVATLVFRTIESPFLALKERLAPYAPAHRAP